MREVERSNVAFLAAMEKARGDPGQGHANVPEIMDSLARLTAATARGCCSLNLDSFQGTGRPEGGECPFDRLKAVETEDLALRTLLLWLGGLTEARFRECLALAPAHAYFLERARAEGVIPQNLQHGDGGGGEDGEDGEIPDELMYAFQHPLEWLVSGVKMPTPEPDGVTGDGEEEAEAEAEAETEEEAEAEGARVPRRIIENRASLIRFFRALGTFSRNATALKRLHLRFNGGAGDAPPGVTGQLERLAQELGLSSGAVTSLIAAARAGAPAVFARYHAVKAGILGLGRLSFPDISEPVPSAPVSFRRALRETLGAFRAFSPAMAEAAGRVAGEGRLSAGTGGVRDASAGGDCRPFCTRSGPDGVPLVRVPWTGLPGDPFALAHELGHAAHHILAGERAYLIGPEWNTLAEAAAAFAEGLAARRLIAGAETERSRRGLLCTWLDGIRTNVLGGVFQTLFELEAREADRDGSWPEDLTDAFAPLLAEEFGDAVHAPPEGRWLWLVDADIFLGDFTNFGYLFARLLALALEDVRGREGGAFAGRYVGVLAATGTASLEDLLADAGIGPLDEAFWRRGIDRISRIIDML
jgi:hypothetical protein